MPDPFALPLHGDVEAAVVDLLRSATEVTALGDSAHISTDLKGYTKGDLWVMVGRQGGNIGATPANRIDRPRIDIEVYGQTRTPTFNLINMAQAVILRDGRTYTGHGLRMTASTVESGIVRLDDKLQELPKYVLAVRLSCVPHP